VLWNGSQSISFSTKSEVSLIVTGSGMLNVIGTGRWSESRMSVTVGRSDVPQCWN
jgi:hypothetical protein